MQRTLSQWLNYYRASLIDTARKEQRLSHSITRENGYIDCLRSEEVQKIWKLSDVREMPQLAENGQQKMVEYNTIDIAPIALRMGVKHAARNKEKTYYPYWVPAYLLKDGTLLPPSKDELPRFLRENISPNPYDTPALTTIKKLENVALQADDLDRSSWQAYWLSCENYFTTITGKTYDNTDFYNSPNAIQIADYDDVAHSASTHIVGIYEHLIARLKDKGEKVKTGVLEKLLCMHTPEQAALRGVDDILIPAHYGHMSAAFPLSKSQREAFAKAHYEGHADIFAINGPPGTGKTTILQSFIANHIVQAVLNERDSLLMVGCSTNNQAITNILDSMKIEHKEQDVLQQRWIEGLSSFGLYFASKDKKEECEAKGYQWVESVYFDTPFVMAMENWHNLPARIDYMKTKFTTYANHKKYNYNPALNIESIKQDLKKWIFMCKKEIDEYVQAAKNMAYIIAEDEATVREQIAQQQTKIAQYAAQIEHLEACKKRVAEQYKNFSFSLKISPFASAKKTRENACKVILKNDLDAYPKDFPFYDYDKVKAQTDTIILQIHTAQKRLHAACETLVREQKERAEKCMDYERKMRVWQEKYADRWERLIRMTGQEYQGLSVAEDMAARLDISLRHQLFWLCVHYREVLFLDRLTHKKQRDEQLKKAGKSLGKQRSEKQYRARLNSIALLCPLFIATFHTLPKYCTYAMYDFVHKKNNNGYYGNLFDYMIVDEAGQVSPEVAIASFSFTKKLLAVGDVYQIEPIWGVTPEIDLANANKYKIIQNENERDKDKRKTKDKKDFKRLAEQGFMASSGSVMKLAQHASHFSYKTTEKTEKGVLLKEHRRCVDPIITYANRFVYGESLILKGGAKSDALDALQLPALGYLHINGFCEKLTSSRSNIAEAQSIAQWLARYKDRLTAVYKKALHEIVGIVTPYAAQKLCIKNAIANVLEQDMADKITIGTVHALQGAERAIILFSSTDSEGENLFMDMDNKHNMLNVATTRAKHSFLVFGNMRIFQRGQNSPSSHLADLLYAEEKNALDNSFLYVQDTPLLSEQEKKELQATQLNTLQKHRDVLKKCFKVAEREIIICSPFISATAIEKDELVKDIMAVRARGVKVYVISDKYFDFDKKTGHLKEQAKRGRELLTNIDPTLLSCYDGMHNKTICVDDKIYIEGSFNWLSASRDKDWANVEISIVVQGGKVGEMIAKVREMFALG